MNLEVYTENDVVWVKLEGRLDIEGTERVEDTFRMAISEAGRGVVVDMEDVDFITSMGLRMLMTAATDLRKRAGRLLVLKPQWRVRESLMVSGLIAAIPIAEDPEDVRTLLLD